MPPENKCTVSALGRGLVCLFVIYSLMHSFNKHSVRICYLLDSGCKVTCRPVIEAGDRYG